MDSLILGVGMIFSFCMGWLGKMKNDKLSEGEQNED